SLFPPTSHRRLPTIDLFYSIRISPRFYHFFFLTIPPPPRSTLFPYTTLFRSMKSLGGLRKPVKDSTVNSAWLNSGFRGYADYMQTPEFEAALAELIRLLKEKTTVYCCTEAVFWRCHRQLVSDALLARGYRVGHLFNATKVEEHTFTKFVKAEGTTLTYPSLL